MKAISVYGIGKLGLPACACLAEQGYRIIGVDLNETVVKMVNQGNNPFMNRG